MVTISDKTIEKALKEGRLVDYDKLFASYPKTKQEKIKKRARYLMVAMELRRLRKQLNLSQEKLAIKLKVKREYVARIESGKQNVTLETLYKIAEATGKNFEFTFK